MAVFAASAHEICTRKFSPYSKCRRQNSSLEVVLFLWLVSFKKDRFFKNDYFNDNEKEETFYDFLGFGKNLRREKYEPFALENLRSMERVDCYFHPPPPSRGYKFFYGVLIYTGCPIIIAPRTPVVDISNGVQNKLLSTKKLLIRKISQNFHQNYSKISSKCFLYFFKVLRSRSIFSTILLEIFWKTFPKLPHNLGKMNLELFAYFLIHFLELFQNFFLSFSKIFLKFLWNFIKIYQKLQGNHSKIFQNFPENVCDGVILPKNRRLR